jgi:hypothetical protein
MKTPHKHAELIKAWADGATIEVRMGSDDDWMKLAPHPAWDSVEYRIKPEPKPDVIREYICTLSGMYYAPDLCQRPNLRLVFDGETGKLIKAEVLA